MKDKFNPVKVINIDMNNKCILQLKNNKIHVNSLQFKKKNLREGQITLVAPKSISSGYY